MAVKCGTVRHQEVLRHPQKTRAPAVHNCMLCFFNKAAEGDSTMVTMYQTIYNLL